MTAWQTMDDVKQAMKQWLNIVPDADMTLTDLSRMLAKKDRAGVPGASAHFLPVLAAMLEAKSAPPLPGDSNVRPLAGPEKVE